MPHHLLPRSPTSNDNNPDDGGNAYAIIGYAIGGTACVLALLLVAWTFFRRRHLARRNRLIAAQNVGAVHAANMAVYARRQEARVRRANGANHRKNPLVHERSPPPGYWNGSGVTLPTYPGERAVVR